MYLPISWLRELLELDGVSLEKIENGLFSCGLEVEEKKPVSPDISGVYVGIVTHIERHPDSDHMFVCRLDCGERGRDIQIVPGAQNVNAGVCVPVALEGATVYARKKDDTDSAPKVITIKPGKLRGAVSYGMLCSGEELGIDEDWYTEAVVDGIMKLPGSLTPGTAVRP